MWPPPLLVPVKSSHIRGIASQYARAGNTLPWFIMHLAAGSAGFIMLRTLLSDMMGRGLYMSRDVPDSKKSVIVLVMKQVQCSGVGWPWHPPSGLRQRQKHRERERLVCVFACVCVCGCACVCMMYWSQPSWLVDSWHRKETDTTAKAQQL